MFDQRELRPIRRKSLHIEDRQLQKWHIYWQWLCPLEVAMLPIVNRFHNRCALRASVSVCLCTNVRTVSQLKRCIKNDSLVQYRVSFIKATFSTFAYHFIYFGDAERPTREDSLQSNAPRQRPQFSVVYQECRERQCQCIVWIAIIWGNDYRTRGMELYEIQNPWASTRRYQTLIFDLSIIKQFIR